MATLNVLTPECIVCGQRGTVALDADTYMEGMRAWNLGALLQHAFPTVAAELREQLKTGIHPECWDSMF